MAGKPSFLDIMKALKNCLLYGILDLGYIDARDCARLGAAMIEGGVKEGTIAGTVVQQPFEWAYQGFKLMAAYVKGDKSGIPANKLIIVPTKIIGKDDVEAYAANLKAMQGN